MGMSSASSAGVRGTADDKAVAANKEEIKYTTRILTLAVTAQNIFEDEHLGSCGRIVCVSLDTMTTGPSTFYPQTMAQDTRRHDDNL